MTIAKERIEAIKRDVDLVALVQTKGIELKKNGKSYRGLCPFHEDTNPSLSINPVKNLWQCFGCGAGGDAIRFVEMFDQVPFPEAVSRLKAEGSPVKSASHLTGQAKLKVKPKTTNNRPQATNLSVIERKLLTRVVSYYQHTLTKDSRGINYLKGKIGVDQVDFNVPWIRQRHFIRLIKEDKMPRRARLDAPGTLHHVIVRGIEKRRIVNDVADRKNFVKRLGELAAGTKTSI